jgi:hypothetical protein
MGIGLVFGLGMEERLGGLSLVKMGGVDGFLP